MIARIPLVLDPQPEGGYTVTSPLLPELITEGDTVSEALANAEDAFAAVIEIYEDKGRPLPSKHLPGRHERPRLTEQSGGQLLQAADASSCAASCHSQGTGGGSGSPRVRRSATMSATRDRMPSRASTLVGAKWLTSKKPSHRPTQASLQSDQETRYS